MALDLKYDDNRSEHECDQPRDMDRNIKQNASKGVHCCVVAADQICKSKFLTSIEQDPLGFNSSRNRNPLNPNEP